MVGFVHLKQICVRCGFVMEKLGLLLGVSFLWNGFTQEDDSDSVVSLVFKNNCHLIHNVDFRRKSQDA